MSRLEHCFVLLQSLHHQSHHDWRVREARQEAGRQIIVCVRHLEAVFGLLVFTFHIVEVMIKRFIHRADFAKASGELRLDQFAVRSIAVFGSGGDKEMHRTAQ